MGEFISKTKTFEYNTKERLDFITITSEIADFVKESGIKSGLTVIQTHHTTCGVWINEDEKNLIGPPSSLGYVNDLKKVLDNFAHPDEEYGHNDVKDSSNPSGKRDTHLCTPDSCGVIPECKNGHAHAQSMILQSSISMIVSEGKLAKGEWQEVMLVELDHDRKRKVTVLVQGTKD
jgi:thiamine phosphate synthase YjbQ (UPF0047 family)|tara:strand:+ start:251 stop:778 length:528 start_codon:yes stop_codon:yes gene_type:complete